MCDKEIVVINFMHNENYLILNDQSFSLKVILLCEENVCKNGGSCSRHVNDYSCECLPGFSGYLCEEGMANYFVVDVFS